MVAAGPAAVSGRRWEALAANAWWLPLLAMVGALAIRLFRLGDRSLWLDEAFTAKLAAQPASAILLFRDYHPPLYTLFLHYWSGLGAWAASDAGLRLPSALASAAGVGLSVWLVRRLGLPGAGIVAVLGATSSLSVWYAQEARMYALPGLALLVAAGALALVAKLPSAGAERLGWGEGLLWTTYAAAMLVGLYLHYDAIAVAVVLNLGYLVLARPGEARFTRWAAANFVVVALYVPQLPAALDALSRGGPSSLTSRLPRFIAAGVAGAAVVGGAGLLAWRRPQLRRPMVAAGAALLLLGLDVVDLSIARLDLKRHASLVLPIALTVAGVALGWARVPWRGVGVLVAAGLPALYLTLFVYAKEDWRGVADVLHREVQASDAVLVYRSFALDPFNRYYHGPPPAIGVAGPGSLDGLRPVLDSGRRVWLIELSYMENPATLAPYLRPRRRVAYESVFYDIVVRRFDPTDGPVPAPDGPDAAATRPQTFSGSGDRRVAAFALAAGDYLVRWRASPSPGAASCYQRTWLEGAGGAFSQRLTAVEVGKDGRGGEVRVPGLVAGEYRFTVESGCDWSVTLTPQSGGG